MIDAGSEKILEMTDCAGFVQRRFGGRKPSQHTLYRWYASGLRGIRLETMKRGGTRVTSEEAVARFFERLADDGQAELPANDTPRPSPSGVRVDIHEHLRAAALLMAEGV